jgi:hypothetical protein
MKYLILFILFFTISCNWAKEKAKNTVNKTGEIVAETGSEFVDGVKKGVHKTFQNDITLSEKLIDKGLKKGKVEIIGSDSTSNNILSIYLIFDATFEQPLTVKLFSNTDEEYGRITQLVNGQQGEAKYVDFVFDKRISIDSKSKIIIE